MAQSHNSKQNDLLSVTAFISALLHTVLILAVSFKLPEIADRSNIDNNLDVVLLNNANKQSVEDAEFVSSAGNEGGGDDDRSGKTPIPWKAVNPSPVQSVAKTAKRVTETRVSPDRLLTTDQSEVSLERRLAVPETLKVNGNETGIDPLTTNSRMLERERLLAKTSRDWENYQKRPRKKFVGPITKAHGAAKYLDAWKKRVVTVGNANYPIQIKARGLHGTLIMSIEINSNGTIHSIKVIQPSQYKLLNDAALRIIRDASPFEAFPDEEYFKNTNILVITRAIHFLPDNSFDSTASGRG